MGGNVPLGYDVRDRKLTVNETEADTVRHIYGRYLALRSVRLLKDELTSCGIDSKRRVGSGGAERGGVPLSRGALYLLLQNRIYLGEVTHKECCYPGQHAPIIDRATWDAVQALLASNAGDRTAATRAKEPSLLAGLLHDPAGRPMTPTHAVKDGKRHRYYLSRRRYQPQIEHRRNRDGVTTQRFIEPEVAGLPERGVRLEPDPCVRTWLRRNERGLCGDLRPFQERPQRGN